MKLDQIMAKCDKMRKLNAKLVRVVGYKTGFDKKGLPTAVAKTYTPREYTVNMRLVRAKDQNKYVSSVKFLDRKLNVKVSCSCKDFLYRWEVALAERGAADIIYSNAEPPDDTNPEHRPGCCIAKGALVTTNQGEKVIEDIVAGDQVLTLLGWRPVVATACLGKKEVVRVTTKGGLFVDVTADHRILTIANGEIGWVEAKDLSISSKVFQILPKSVGGKVLSLVPEAVLAGLLIAEADEFGYAPVEPEVRAIFEKNYLKVFGRPPRYKNRKAKHIQLVDINHVARSLGFTHACSKDQRLPKSFLTKDKEFKASLLYGLFLGDGCFGDTDASYGTSSVGLAHDVQQLLRGLGVYSRIRKNGKDRLWHVRIPPSSRPRLLSYFGKYRFKYVVSAHTPSEVTGSENILDVDLKEWWNNLRSFARHQASIIPSRYTHLVRVQSESILPMLKTDYSQFLYKVKLDTSHRHVSFTYTEVKDFLRRLSRMESYLCEAVPYMPGSKSKRKLSRWLNSCTVHTQQTDLLRYLLDDRVSAHAITDIRPLDTKKVVYDIEVEEAEHFTANGIVVHNCKHIIALRALIKEKHGV